MLTVILLSPASVNVFIAGLICIESWYWIAGIIESYNITMLLSSSVLFTVIRIESLIALPMFINFMLMSKLLSAIEIIAGLILIAGSSTILSGLGCGLIFNAGSPCNVISSR